MGNRRGEMLDRKPHLIFHKAMRLFRSRFMPALVLLAAVMGSNATGLAQSSSPPAIDWGKAGKGAEPPKIATPQPEKPKLPDSGFDCSTVTRLSIEEQRLNDRTDTGPREVKRCSRDGFSLELSAPQN